VRSFVLFTGDDFAVLLQKVKIVLPTPRTLCLAWLSLMI